MAEDIITTDENQEKTLDKRTREALAKLQAETYARLGRAAPTEPAHPATEALKKPRGLLSKILAQAEALEVSSMAVTPSESEVMPEQRPFRESISKRTLPIANTLKKPQGLIGTKKSSKILTQAGSSASEVEAQEVLKPGQLGFMAWPFVQATMPHSEPKKVIINGEEQELNEFERKNGDVIVSMQSPRRIGLPYGGKPRLILAWITTEAVRTNNPIIDLGKSQNEFIRRLNLGTGGTGGADGNIKYLKNQMKRLLACHITCFSDRKGLLMNSLKPIKAVALYWWNSKDPEQETLWESTLTISQDFFEAIVRDPVPIRMDKLKALSRSPMAMDIYLWLTHKNFKPSGPLWLSWADVQDQFGAEYSNPKLSDAENKRDFKANFLKAYKKVVEVYPDGKLQIETDKLIYVPGRPDVPKIYKLSEAKNSKEARS